MLRTWLERGFWRIAAWICTTRTVGNVKFIYVNARADRLIQELAPVLEQALQRIDVAGQEYRELIRTNIRFVAAANVRADYVSVPAQGYVTAFTAPEALSPHYLAANLVWAAAFIRAQRADEGGERLAGVTEARQVAKEVQLRFVKEFPDSDPWVDFLAAHKH